MKPRPMLLESYFGPYRGGSLSISSTPKVLVLTRERFIVCTSDGAFGQLAPARRVRPIVPQMTWANRIGFPIVDFLNAAQRSVAP